jgi:hypothetical protein
MELNVEELRSRLTTELRELIDTSESLYLSLAEVYPRIIEEMERSLEASGRAASSAERSTGYRGRVDALVAEGIEIVREAEEDFRAMSDEDSSLVGELSSTIESLSALDGLIERIREDSVEMELVSLNALTVALKSGSAGKAFSVITDELKRLSMRTISLTEGLTERGRAIFTQFSDFKRGVEGMEKARGELFSSLELRLDSSLSKLQRGIAEVASDLERMAERSGGVREPVKKIMETIQFQDIIRQSIEHVMMSLESMVDSGPGESGEKDNYLFLKTLADLSVRLLDDVISQLRLSIDSFSGNIGVVEEIITEGDKSRLEFLERFKDSDTATLFDVALKTINDIIDDANGYIRDKSQLVQRGRGLSEGVDALEERFQLFSQVVNRFRTIDIASRIEVAKQSILRTMNDTVNAMSTLTIRIENDVVGAVERTKSLIESTRATMDSSIERIGVQSRLIQSKNERFAGNLSGLQELRDAIKQGVSGFTLFTDGFVSLVADSRRDLDRLESLYSRLEAVRVELSGLRDFTSSRLEGMSGGVDEAIHNERLRGIIDRFTIFTHKQAAGEIAGFAVEQGSSTGEVTLF